MQSSTIVNRFLSNTRFSTNSQNFLNYIHRNFPQSWTVFLLNTRFSMSSQYFLNYIHRNYELFREQWNVLKNVEPFSIKLLFNLDFNLDSQYFFNVHLRVENDFATIDRSITESSTDRQPFHRRSFGYSRETRSFSLRFLVPGVINRVAGRGR